MQSSMSCVNRHASCSASIFFFPQRGNRDELHRLRWTLIISRMTLDSLSWCHYQAKKRVPPELNSQMCSMSHQGVLQKAGFEAHPDKCDKTFSRED